MKASMFVVLTALLVLLSAFSTYAKDAFTEDLKLGTVSPQVKLLQEYLNQNPATIVANSGSGSKGNETDYFGKLTESAVIRFQGLHRSEILVPAGLSVGSGFVGPLTRGVLNVSANSLTINTSSLTSTAPQGFTALPVAYPTSTPFFSTSTLQALAPYLPATFVSSQFYSSSTTVQFEALGQASHALIDLYKNEFNVDLSPIPATSTEHQLYSIKNGALPPKITIKEIPKSFSDTIVITGSGIASKNTVNTTIGSIVKISSSPNTISVRLYDLPGFSLYENMPKGSLGSTTIMIWINNENGTSNLLGPYSVNF